MSHRSKRIRFAFAWVGETLMELVPKKSVRFPSNGSLVPLAFGWQPGTILRVMLQIYMRRKNAFRKPIPITLWQTHSWVKEIVIRVRNCPDARKRGLVVQHPKTFRYLKRECRGGQTPPGTTEPRIYFSLFSRSGAAATRLKQKLSCSALCGPA